MRGQWLVGECDGSNTFSLELFDGGRHERPTVGACERGQLALGPSREPGGDLRYLRSIPSARYVPLLTGRDADRGSQSVDPARHRSESRTCASSVQQIAVASSATTPIPPTVV